MEIEEAIERIKELQDNLILLYKDEEKLYEAIERVLEEIDKLNFIILAKERGIAELETLVDQLEKDLEEYRVGWCNEGEKCEKLYKELKEKEKLTKE